MASLREILAGGTPLDDRAYQADRRGFAPQEAPRGRLELEDMPQGTPMVRGGANLGNVGVSGSYYRPHPQAPAEWRALGSIGGRF